MPKGLVSPVAFLAERMLFEGDGVPSAIRIVDVFLVDKPTDEVSKENPPAVVLNLYVSLRFTQGSDPHHTIQIKILRPSGELKVGEEPRHFTINATKYPEAPAGASAVIQIPVFVKEFGTHFLITEVDGEEVIRTAFTLLPRESSPSTN